MKTILTSVLLSLILTTDIGLASGYEITKVIEIGPGGGAIVGTVKWSPDGTELAYFDKCTLKISDSLGNSREITHFDLTPHRYEWLSNNEIIIGFWQFLSAHIDTSRLVIIDISTGKVSPLAEHRRGPANEHRGTWFDGPFVTVEGTPYYKMYVNEGSDRGPVKTVFPRSAYTPRDNPPHPSENHIVAWGEDGLYLIKADLSDSTRIAPKPYDHILLPPALKADLSYYIHGGTMYRFSDSSYIVLDTMIKEDPPGTVGHGFMYGSFNPHASEVVVTLGFDYDGHSTGTTNIATYSYTTSELTVLDSTLHLEDCERPTYAPDGLKIAFQSQGRLFILYRKE